MDKEKHFKGVIYKYTFPNGKVYIGQTINPRSRKSQHLCKSTGARHISFWRAYKKYGTFEYEEIEVIEEPTKELLCEKLNTLEQFYIAQYRSTNPKYGYNLTSGGKVFVVNEEGRKRMSEARKNKLSVLQYDLEGNFVKEYESTTAAGKALGVAATNIWSCCLGFSKGKRKKKVQIVNGYTFRFKKDYPDVPSRIDLNITNLNKRNVLQFSLDGVFIKEWESVLDAERGTGTRESGIRQVCYGKYRQCNGYMWRYRDEFNEIPAQIDPVRPKVKRPFPKLTEEQIEKGKRINRERYARVVHQFSFSGDYVATFPSLDDAAARFGGDGATICNACKQVKSKTAYGYQWRYKEDVTNPLLGIEPFDRRASSSRRRPVIQLTPDGVFVREWVSTRAAAEYYNISRNTLYMALSGRKQFVRRYIWKYKDTMTTQEKEAAGIPG